MAAGTCKIECFVIIVNGFKPLTILTKHSILDIAAGLDTPLKAFIQTCSFYSMVLIFIQFLFSFHLVVIY